MAASHVLNILVVHGIGWGGRGNVYARPMQDNIQHEFDRAIRRLKLKDVNKRDARGKRALRFEAACWDPVTQQPQDGLLQLMFGRMAFFRRLNLTYQFRRNMVGLVGDVIAYECDENNKVYRAIHEEIDKSVDKLSQASRAEEDGYGHLTVIGHSLGSVIASDYIWDNTRSTGHSHRLGHYDLALCNMITMGSPMALYSLRNNAYGKRESIRQSMDCPISIDPDGGVWLNLYDKQDVIAFPLEPIESYQHAGVIDCAVNSGTWLTRWNLASHVGYWRSDDVARLIAHKLAIDWARLNSPQFAEHGYDKALAEFRRSVGKV